MSDRKTLVEPTNRTVCVFDDYRQAVDAKAALIESGFDKDRIRVLHGDQAASTIDTSAKWFADTDEELKKFERELHAGNTLLSVPVKDSACREEVHDILNSHEARHITHFGQWVTEVMR